MAGCRPSKELHWMSQRTGLVSAFVGGLLILSLAAPARVTAGQTLFGGEAELAPQARAMISRVGPVEAASSVATVDATVRRTDYIDEGRTGGIAVTAADLDLYRPGRQEADHKGRYRYL